jgi:hypothetical protein
MGKLGRRMIGKWSEKRSARFAFSLMQMYFEALVGALQMEIGVCIPGIHYAATF